MIKISVIIPVFNSSEYIDRCLNSVINQTYKNLEIIIVNDGSTDNSLEICEKYKKIDDRIIILNKQNQGSAAARNCGIDVATGEYITFIDSDDSIDVETYEYLSMRISETSDIICYGMVEEYPDYHLIKNNHFTENVYNRNELEKKIFPEMLSRHEFFNFGILPNLVCKLIKTIFLKSAHLEMDTSIKIGEDANMTYQLISQASEIQIIDYNPYHYYKRNNSMMSKDIDIETIRLLRTNMWNSFKRAGIAQIMCSQLEDYITFVTLLKFPKFIIQQKWDFKDKRIALYGAGGFGQAMYKDYKENIVKWVDKNYKMYNKSGMNIMEVGELCKDDNSYDIIFLAILNTTICKNIRKELIAQNICKEILFFTI